MKVLIIASTIAVPTLMLYLQYLSDRFRLFFNVVAIISSIIFGCIAATSIYQIIVDDAVFMTTIHAIFLNPLFLVVGSYLGMFIIYRLLLLTVDEKKHPAGM